MGLRGMLTDKSTIATLTVLYDMLMPVVQFSDYLQGDVHFCNVNDKVKELLDELDHLTNRFKMVAEGVEDNELYFSRLENLWFEIDERTDLSQRRRNHGQLLTIRQYTVDVAIPLVHSLKNEITDAFHCTPVLSAFSIFDLSKVPNDIGDLINYGQTSIRYLADHYGVTKQDTFMGHTCTAQPEFEAFIIVREFDAFKNQTFMMKQRALSEGQPDIGNSYLLQQMLSKPEMTRAFPCMTYFILLSCLIPSSTACVERVFSLMNSLCTLLRSSMKQETLDNIMRIVHEGSTSLTPELLNKALEHFNLKDRKLNF